MLILLSRYWPYIVAGIAIVGLVLTINHWRSEAAKVPGLQDELRTAQLTLATERKRNQDNKIITEETSRAYQNNLTSIKRERDTLRLRYKTACVNVQPPVYTTRPDGTSEPRINAVTLRLGTDWLIDYGTEGETYRKQVTGLQDFITRVYAAQ